MSGEGFKGGQEQTVENNDGVANQWIKMGEEMQQVAEGQAGGETGGEAKQKGGPVELWEAEVVDKAGDVLGQTKAGVAGVDYYVVDEGVPVTPEMEGDESGVKPQMRMYVDPGLENVTIKQVQIEEVPGEEEAEVTEVTEEVSWEAVDKAADKREGLDSWLKTVEGTPEEYWQRLAEAGNERGVELGEMPDLKKFDAAIERFFENGLTGVEREARAVREEMARKAVLQDIARRMEKTGGELDEEALRAVFYDAQRRLEEVYRGNRGLREDAQGPEMSANEQIAWHLAMEPRDARVNPLLIMQQHVRRPGETSDDYEKRLRDYAEDTLEHQKRLEDDKEYTAANPMEAAEYATRVLRNAQREDLPEYTYMRWEEVGDAGEQTEVGEVIEAVGDQVEGREGRVKRLFERVREKIGFRKVADKVMRKVAGAIAGAVNWANEVLAEEGEGDMEGGESEEDNERGKMLRALRAAKAETERRMANDSGDDADVLDWARRIMKLNARIGELEAEMAV